MKATYLVLFILIISSCGTPQKKGKNREHNEKDHNHKSGSSSMKKYTMNHPELKKAQLLDLKKIEEDGVTSMKHIYPLDEVVWTPVEEVVNVQFEDEVTTFRIKDTYYVLPWYVMKNHHVGNLSLQGEDVVVTLCEACSGSAAFSPMIDDQKLTFRLGGIYNGTNCMVDEDGDVWGTFTGKALTGPLKGRELDRIQMYQGKWQDWLRVGFGETLVADYTAEFRSGHGSDFHIGDDRVSFRKTMERPIDKRLPNAEMVQGVYLNGEERAYQHKILKKKGVIMDTLGGEQIVLLSTPKTSIMSCFNRVLDGRLLTFSLKDDQIIDTESGSVWRMDGLAIEGALKGKQLDYIPNYHEEWYAWAAYRPETTIYE